MVTSVDELMAVLDLETVQENLFRGRQPDATSLPMVYGGQVAAQAVAAAQRTVPDDRHVHSAHMYFLLRGDTSVPLMYEVERVRDGRSFSTRRVSATQNGRTIFTMMASFHGSESSVEHQTRMAASPPPEDCPTFVDYVAGRGLVDDPAAWLANWGAFDLRYVGDPRPAGDPSRDEVPAIQRVWFKTRDTVDGLPAMHTAMFAWISDFTLIGASTMPHSPWLGSDHAQTASLDHTIWFRRPFRIDQWLMYEQTSPWASGARGLSTANVFTQDGQLVASTAQEGLLRL